MTYDVRDVSNWPALDFAARGTTAKEWLIDPDGDADEPEWLWKEVAVEHTGLERQLGHDWGERVAREVAGLLGVPAHEVQLARRGERRGVVCRSFASDRAGHPALSNANELLPNFVAGYDPNKKGEAAGYTLDAVFAVLDDVAPPAGSDNVVQDAHAAFAGVLVLDALIANQDRHHENWGILQDRTSGETLLAPAFDSACCLGYQERQDKKTRLLDTGEIDRWARRGRANQFESRPNLVDLAIECLGRLDRSVAAFWMRQLKSVTCAKLQAVVTPVPDDLMSQVDRSFAVILMCTNQKRILDAWANYG